MKQWIFKPSEALKVLPMLIQHMQSLPDKQYALELKRHTRRRSLDANAYAWALINRIAGVMGIDPEEVYRQALRKSGGNYEVMPVRDDALDAWERIWSSRGIGWQTRALGPCKNTPGYTNVVCYYGSSVFDTKQMSNLIENLVQDAQELGIETMTPDERTKLVGLWQ